MEDGVAGVDGLAAAEPGCSTDTDRAPTLDHRMGEDAVLGLPDRPGGASQAPEQPLLVRGEP